MVEEFLSSLSIKEITKTKKRNFLNLFINTNLKKRNDIITAKNLYRWVSESTKENGSFNNTNEKADTVLHRLYALKDFLYFLSESKEIDLVEQGSERRIHLHKAIQALKCYIGKF